MKIKKILTFSIFLLSALFVSNQMINASEGMTLSIVVDEYAGAINPTLYIDSSDNGIYTDEQGMITNITSSSQKSGFGDLYLIDYPEYFDGGIYKIQFHNIDGYESTGVFYEVSNVGSISVSALYEHYIFKIYDNNSQLIGTQDLYEGRYKIDFVIAKDNIYPVIDGKTDYITNVNNPISESDIKAGLYAYDNIDGDISLSFVLVSDGYTANKNKLGTYDIIYKVSDSAGNESQVIVKVHVVDATKPVISGKSIYTIDYNQTQSLTTVLNNLTVTDNYQSGIIPVLFEDNYTVNKAVKGSYTVKYKATDNSGNESDLFVVT
ncbi:MAG: immunoglobulin-like domain-containing protein, partial [Bacilli bacterium]